MTELIVFIVILTLLFIGGYYLWKALGFIDHIFDQKPIYKEEDLLDTDYRGDKDKYITFRNEVKKL
jgi:hypothetical protein